MDQSGPVSDSLLLAIADRAFRLRLVGLLEALGLRAFGAETAAEAEELAEAERPALALIDLGLGEGLEIARRFLAEELREAIFVVPAQAEEALLDASAELAPRGYLEAGASAGLVVATLKSALGAQAKLRALAEKAARLREAAKAHPDLMLILDEEGRYLEVLTSNEELLYRPAAEMIGRKIDELFEPELARPFLELIGRAARGEATAPFEYRIPTPAGSTWFEGRTAPFGRSAEGKKLVVFIARDVTARRNAEAEARRAVAEKEVLLRELQHRVKNNLAMMASLFSLEAARLGRAEDRAVFANAEDRLRAMAFVYDKLYSTEGVSELEMSAYIEELSRDLAASYAGGAGPVRLDFSLQPATIELRRAVPLGLALTEFVTNAFKYGFPEGQGGRIAIGFGIEGGDFLLGVEDDGLPLPPDFDPAKAEGTGIRLVSILAGQLGGSLSWGEAQGGGGARFELRFPVKA